MSVHVVDASGASWTIVADECGHTGQTDPSTLRYGLNLDGTENRAVVVIPCAVPGCGTVSWWPSDQLPPAVLEKVS